MKKQFPFLACIVCFLSVVCTGQAVAEDKGHKPTIQAERNPAAARSRLEKEVRHELVMLPYFTVFDNLGYRVNGNTVELTGQVTKPTLKSSAERVVKSIEGVESVTNNIEVLPTSPNDDRLRVAVYRAVYGNASLQVYNQRYLAPIRIIVKNGNVTLEGVVGSEMDKNMANVQANSVSGVFSVTNNLEVDKG
jgi:hyperosmotically inducible protein